MRAHAGVDAAAVAALPDWRPIAARLRADGYEMRPLGRALRQPDGAVVVRLVWRRRRDGGCAVVQQALRGELPGRLLDAVMASLAS